MTAGTFEAHREMVTYDPSPQHCPIASAALRAVRHSRIGSHARPSDRLEHHGGRLAFSRVDSSICLPWFQGGAEGWQVRIKPARLSQSHLPEQRTPTEETWPRSQAGRRFLGAYHSRAGGKDAPRWKAAGMISHRSDRIGGTEADTLAPVPPAGKYSQSNGEADWLAGAGSDARRTVAKELRRTHPRDRTGHSRPTARRFPHPVIPSEGSEHD